jgi:hypothetical protein
MDTTKKSWNIFPQYVTVMNDYLNHFTGSEKYKKRDKDGNYLLINGFITLSHVFKIMLNADQQNEDQQNEDQQNEDQPNEVQAEPVQAEPVQALQNMEKSIYYYTQFIEQMEESILYDLNVSSNNASLFVYKKTIANLLPRSPTKNDITLQNITKLLRIYQHLFENLINMEAAYSSALPMKLMNVALEICLANKDEMLFQRELESLELFLNHFPPNTHKYEYIYMYIKKYKKTVLTLESVCQKKAHPLYTDKLKTETPQNYIKWLI